MSEAWGVCLIPATHVPCHLVEAVSDNQLAKWRKLVPTFARIEMEGETLLSAEVYTFDEDGQARRVAD